MSVAELKTLMSGLVVGESPRWHDGRLWFSNWGAQEIIALDTSGNSGVVARVSTTVPFSIDWLPDGRMLVVSGPEALLLVQQPDGSLKTYADLSGLARGWNEIVVDGRGNTYVNGSDYRFAPGEPFIAGVIALVTPDGQVRQVAEDIHFPNVMVVTPDNRTLIVTESFRARLTAFDIAADGSLSKRRVWAELGNGVPDGICIDADGAVWYADVPNKRCVRVREGGDVLQTVNAGRGCFACMLGGAGRRTLFILATEWRGMEKAAEVALERTGQLLAIEAPLSGAGWP